MNRVVGAFYSVFCVCGACVRGCSSVVECNLAKVDVEGSNPSARSRFFVCTFSELYTLKFYDVGV